MYFTLGRIRVKKSEHKRREILNKIKSIYTVYTIFKQKYENCNVFFFIGTNKSEISRILKNKTATNLRRK